MSESPYADRALSYSTRVLSGAIPACKWTKAACQRQLDDLNRYADAGEFYWDTEAVEHVCAFVEGLPQIKGEWARRKESVHLEDWQVFILACVFGWKRRADALRRFRIAYIEVARKNGKSTLLAAIALYLLSADHEAGAEVYSLATTRDQASIVFSTSKQMALREPEFREAFGVEVNAHQLWVEESASLMRALSADGNVLDGLNVHGAIVDELHAHNTREVWDVIETATGSRSQPIVWAITTAGTNRAGICYEQRSYVCKLLNWTLRIHDGLGYRVDGDAAEDDTYFGIIYTIDDDPRTVVIDGVETQVPPDDWTDERCWLKANPNFGVSVKPDDMRRLARKATQLASAQPNFLTKRLNVWLNADSAWMDMRAWERCADREMQMEDFRDWELFVGLDLASKIDITATVPIFRKGNQYRLFCKFYLPEDAIEASGNSQYLGWAETEKIIETPGTVLDFDVVGDDLKALTTNFNVKEIPYDQGFAWDFTQRMYNDGLPMVPIPARPLWFSEPMKELEALVLSGRIRHDGNPAMAWMISNVVCRRDTRENIYPRKQHDENKIDGPVSAMLALGRMMVSEKDSSVYEKGGIFSL